MLKHCIEQLPYEACGLLSGYKGIANRIWKMENKERSPASFAMDLVELEIAFQKIKEMGEELVGIYHSHPSAPPVPSSRDIEYANYPEAAYLILSLKNKTVPQLKVYQINSQTKQASYLPFSIIKD